MNMAAIVDTETKIERLGVISSCVSSHEVCMKKGIAKLVELSRAPNNDRHKKFYVLECESLCDGIQLEDGTRTIITQADILKMWYAKDEIRIIGKGLGISVTILRVLIDMNIDELKYFMINDPEMIKLVEYLNLSKNLEIKFDWESGQVISQSVADDDDKKHEMLLIYRRTLFRIYMKPLIQHMGREDAAPLFQARIRNLLNSITSAPTIRIPEVKIETPEIIVDYTYYLSYPLLEKKLEPDICRIIVGKYSEFIISEALMGDEMHRKISSLELNDKVIRDFIIQFAQGRTSTIHDPQILRLIMSYLRVDQETLINWTSSYHKNNTHKGVNHTVELFNNAHPDIYQRLPYELIYDTIYVVLKYNI
jgi:hypothetical protein